ncbi:MAG: Hsp20/alpha crystallin family protein [Vicinamibacteria bacterium]|nr:Hsp20/alpha crystallin family protein [Vicinamibacteria bacterium]
MSRREYRGVVTDLAFLQKEVDRIFARLTALDRTERVAAGEWTPAVDVFESHDDLTIIVEAPGLMETSLSIICKNRQLVISGERQPESASRKIQSFLCMERPHGRFTRSIPISLAVDARKAEAHLKEGLLIIKLPRLKDRRNREIVIPILRDNDNER